MPRTASMVVAYDASDPQQAEWSDPITLESLADMERPVVLNGDAPETVYELSSVINAHRNANAGLICGRNPFRSPITRNRIDVRAPGALVAVRWGDSPEAIRQADATEAALRRMGLEPAETFDPRFLQQTRRPPAAQEERRTAAEWIAAMREMFNPATVDFRLQLPADPRRLEDVYVCEDAQDPGPIEAGVTALTFLAFERPPAVARVMMPSIHAVTVALKAQLGRCMAHAMRREGWRRALALLSGSALGLLDEFTLLRAHMPAVLLDALLEAAEAHGQRRWNYMLASLDATLRGHNLNEARQLLVTRLLPSAESIDTEERMDSLRDMLRGHEAGQELLAQAEAAFERERLRR